MTVIRVPSGGERLSMNGRYHWRERAARTEAWRKAAYIGATRLGTPAQRRQPPSAVLCEFPVRDRRTKDPHNLAPTVKAIIDGLVDAGVWPDDNPEWVTVVDPRFLVVGPKWRTEPVMVHLLPREDDR